MNDLPTLETQHVGTGYETIRCTCGCRSAGQAHIVLSSITRALLRQRVMDAHFETLRRRAELQQCRTAAAKR